ncbi:MAG TPA: CHAT domain-containing protein [Roseomonas sp.]|jgi:hypothetical protein
MPIRLDNETRFELVKALVESFADADALAAAVLIRTGTDLTQQMDLGGGRSAAVTKVVAYTEGQEWLDKVIEAALIAAPGNQPLQRIADRLGVRPPPPRDMGDNSGAATPRRDGDFLIRLLQSVDGFTILARNRAGQLKEATVDAVPDRLLRNLPHIQAILLQGAVGTRGIVRALNRASDRATLREMGEDVFRFLMPGDVKELFDESRSAAGGRGEKLRVQIDVASAPALAHIPWELAYDKAFGDHLCLAEPTPMCRSVKAVANFARSTRPLRILGMVSKPHLPGLHEDKDTVNFGREQTAITEALNKLGEERVTLHWTTSGTRSELRRMFRSPPSGESWGVFHFIGHGEFDSELSEGYLLLQEAGGIARLSGQNLRHLAVNAGKTPQLVVLNCCSGARAAPGLSFSSVAEKLVQGGIPAVIAMQFEVSERAAQIFSSCFYAQIAIGETVQTALTIARQELCSDDIAEWVTPALYMSGPDFALVDRAP